MTNSIGQSKQANEDRPRGRLATKLIVGILLGVLLPLVIASVVANQFAANQLREQAGDSVAGVAENTANQMSQALVENIHLVQGLSDSSDILLHVEEVNAIREGTEQEILDQILEIDKAWIENEGDIPLAQDILLDSMEVNPTAHQLLEFQERFSRHVEVFSTDRYGALIGSTDLTSDYYQADEEWWQKAWNNGAGDVYIGDPELDESTGVVALNIAVPIFDQSDTVVGVLRSTLDIQEILDIVADNNFGLEGHIAVFDRNATIIFNARNPGAVGRPMPQGLQDVGAIEATERDWARTSSAAGEDVIIGYAKAKRTGGIQSITDLNWTTGAVLPVSEALAPVTASTQRQLLLGLIATLIAIALVSFLVRRSLRQVGFISQLFEQINAGNYEARTDVVTNDELGAMAGDLNSMLDNTLMLIQSQEERDQLQESIIKLLEEVADVADGDLTVEAEVTPEMTGAIADSFNFMISQLRHIIGGVQQTTLRVTRSAEEIESTTERLALSSEAQARQITGASAEIERMASSMQQVSQNAAQSVAVAQAARENAQRGSASVKDTIRGMNRIRDQVQETSRRISRLGQSSFEIDEIVQVINDIADRTSILALNASIQAAAAGEAGRGFAVVASEVEDLAGKTAEATQQVTSMIKTVQAEINEAISAMRESSREVDSGSELADQAGQALAEIEGVSNQLAELIQTISLSTQSQAKETVTVASSMGKIAQVTQETADGTRQTAKSIQDLTQLAEELRGSVSTFKLPAGHQNGQA